MHIFSTMFVSVTSDTKTKFGMWRVSKQRPTLLYRIILDSLCDSDNADLSRVNIILQIQIVEISW